MNPNEKQMRYQALAKLNTMKRDGAKPTVVERLRRSLTAERGGVQKGKVFRGRKTSA
jgi:hypothetical protein